MNIPSGISTRTQVLTSSLFPTGVAVRFSAQCSDTNGGALKYVCSGHTNHEIIYVGDGLTRSVVDISFNYVWNVL